MITNYFLSLDNNCKDTHTDFEWKKINSNNSNALNVINLNYHEDKVFNIPSIFLMN